MLQIVDIGYIDTLFSNTIYVVGFQFLNVDIQYDSKMYSMHRQARHLFLSTLLYNFSYLIDYQNFMTKVQKLEMLSLINNFFLTNGNISKSCTNEMNLICFVKNIVFGEDFITFLHSLEQSKNILLIGTFCCYFSPQIYLFVLVHLHVKFFKFLSSIHITLYIYYFLCF